AAGLSSALPSGASLVLVRTADSVAVIDLRVDQPPPEQTIVLAQIVLSATTVPGVDAVLLTLNGKRINAPLANGAHTSRPLTRTDYRGLLDRPADVDCPGPPIFRPVGAGRGRPAARRRPGCTTARPGRSPGPGTPPSTRPAACSHDHRRASRPRTG